jgi:hypothetical protein
MRTECVQHCTYLGGSFAWRPSAVEDNRIISSAYIRQWVGLSFNGTGSGQFLTQSGKSFINILNK